MSQRRRLKRPKVSGSERRRAAAEARAARDESESGDAGSLPEEFGEADRKLAAALARAARDELEFAETRSLQEIEAEAERRARRFLDRTESEGRRLYALVAQFQAVPHRHKRRREVLLREIRFREGAYVSRLESLAKRPDPQSVPQWLADDLGRVREWEEARARSRARAEETSRRTAKELKSVYNDPRWHIYDR